VVKDEKKAEKHATSRAKLADVRFSIENEGFDYAFRNYSDFKEVDDPEFHKLRQDYVNAANALEKYVGTEEE